ncbi:sugar phosphate isomerase/epimerase [Novosphingobium chloroacetimidivorans]|uniref:Sugar phosphate isomerase/epimerase n=1 Tax=Novosphingobium chloroacetimidivorans TaxID=1428314 RepID=A0A7W7K8E3_9SPHN|nr:sugar phosphate isomerase/epimerase family protein [Novosphingobium chloroacetimidivorans]MBB4858147.1 sugar phosphate isomerase/epimerase [Novosphingobium chloroacetimidivorans]
MKLAVSNIAWPASERDGAYAILARAGFTGLEIAPGLFLAGAADPFAPTDAEVEHALAPMRDAGLTLVSMQSLLFGVSGATLFEGEEPRARLVAAMERAIGLAGRLGIPNLVFGSPRQRAYPDGMSEQDAHDQAAEVFHALGDRALAAGTRIAMEPNGRAYGTNFLNRVEDAEAFVRRVDHPAVVLNFDIGALHMEGDFDRIEAIAAQALDTIGHVHVSEPHLAPAPADPAQAARAIRALQDAGYAGWFSIEMAATSTPLDDLAASVARLQAALTLAGGALPA